MIDERDLLALEAALLLLRDVLQHHVGGRPVGAQQREIPLEHRAVGRLRQAIARGLDRHLVGEGLVRHGERDSGGLRVEARGARALALEALVALDALGCVVGRLAFFVGELDPVHTAVARVDELEVVLLAVGPGNAQRRELARAVDQQRDELLGRLGLGQRARGKHGHSGDGERRAAGKLSGVHCMSPCCGTGGCV